jgi:very-short-patch-repair endonuclease
MAHQRLQPSRRQVLELAESQHGVVARRQLLELGLHPHAITYRIASGRLFPILRGVYAVGRPQITRYGHWMAAVLRCGAEAVLSHQSAAALWGIGNDRSSRVEISLPASAARHAPGVLVHRRAELRPDDLTIRHGIPVTAPICTLVDLSCRLRRAQLEVAINEADKHGLTDPETLRSALPAYAGRPGVSALRRILDRRTFVLTDSELERRFLRIVRATELPLPKTQQRVNGFRVDFYWPDLGLVVETDGLRYHRTPAQQARDKVRDQAHLAAGLTPARFTHEQVRYEPERVRSTLAAVSVRLGRS